MRICLPLNTLSNLARGQAIYVSEVFSNNNLPSRGRDRIYMHQASFHGYIERFCAPGHVQLL